MRELSDMARARIDAEWNHTSAILAMLANVNRDPKRHGPFSPSHFHPMRSKEDPQGIPITRDNISMLKVFCGSKPQ